MHRLRGCVAQVPPGAGHAGPGSVGSGVSSPAESTWMQGYHLLESAAAAGRPPPAADAARGYPGFAGLAQLHAQAQVRLPNSLPFRVNG